MQSFFVQNMQKDLNKVEAVLFTLGRYTCLEELARLTGIVSEGYLKDLLIKLKENYEQRNGALVIGTQGERWKLTIKKEYLFLTEKLLTDSELDGPTQETLAVIAYKSPVMQSEIIKIRGNTAYDHIKILRELDFITADKSGRTRILKVTGKFYDYFDVACHEIKSKFDGALNKNEDK